MLEQQGTGVICSCGATGRGAMLKAAGKPGFNFARGGLMGNTDVGPLSVTESTSNPEAVRKNAVSTRLTEIIGTEHHHSLIIYIYIYI